MSQNRAPLLDSYPTHDPWDKRTDSTCAASDGKKGRKKERKPTYQSREPYRNSSALKVELCEVVAQHELHEVAAVAERQEGAAPTRAELHRPPVHALRREGSVAVQVLEQVCTAIRSFRSFRSIASNNMPDGIGSGNCSEPAIRYTVRRIVWFHIANDRLI